MTWTYVTAIAAPGLELVGALLLSIHIFWRRDRAEQIITEERVARNSFFYMATLWVSAAVIGAILFGSTYLIETLLEQEVHIAYRLGLIALLASAVVKITFPRNAKYPIDNTLQGFLFKLIVFLNKGDRERKAGYLGVTFLLIGLLMQASANVSTLNSLS